jgi:hypothetical protein
MSARFFFMRACDRPGTSGEPGAAKHFASLSVLPTVALFVLGLGFLICPIISTRVPLMHDYLGNMSRVFVLYNLIHGTGFAEMYRIHLAIVPNLAVDGIVLGLMELGLPIEAAGHCFLILMITTLAIGVVALHYATFRRASVWPLLVLPFIYQDGLFWGFINYLLGLGLALIAATAWRLIAPRHLLLAGITLLLFSLALYFSHLLAMLIMCGLVVGNELGISVFSPSRRNWPRVAVAIVASALPLALMLFSPLIADNNPPTLAALLLRLNTAALRARIGELLWFAWGYNSWLDTASLVCFFALGGYAAIRGLIRIDLPSLVPLTGLIAIYLIVPDGWFGTVYLPQRLPLMIFLMAMAATDLVVIRRWERIALLLIITVLMIARGVAVERTWVATNVAFQPLLAQLKSLKPDTRIYSAVAYKGDSRDVRRYPWENMAAYATLFGHAFYPDTFASPSQNIVIRQPVYENAPRMPRNYRVDRPDVPSDNPYDPTLAAFYDYALIINPTLWPWSPPPQYIPIGIGPNYTLFRIER